MDNKAPKPGKWWYFPLTPICWMKTRMIWPYPVSGHRGVYVREYQTETHRVEVFNCMTCGKEILHKWRRHG